MLLVIVCNLISCTEQNRPSQPVLPIEITTVAKQETSLEMTENEALSIYFLDTGNSDAIVIQMNEKVGVIDAGDNDDETYIVKFLQEKTDTLDFILLTHPDADHCGGFDAVVRNFPIEHVWVGNGSAPTKTYQSFIQALADVGA